MDLLYGCFAQCSAFTRCRQCTHRIERNRATPLPKAKIFVVLSILFGNAFGLIVLFPFLPFMVQDFFPELSKEELGQQAGYLGSAYFIGNFAGSMMWGWISDVWGRRPALMVGCLGTIFASLLFGFSQNFATAVSARFLWGLLNGNVGVAKTYLSEILDDSNQAKGFSTFGIASGLGRIFGSVVGGFLSQPASKYSVFKHDFFYKYRYILPIFISVAINGIAFLGVILIMEETLRLQSKTNVSHDHQSHDSFPDSDTDVEMVSLTSENEMSSETDDNDDLMETDMSDTCALLESDPKKVSIQQHSNQRLGILSRLKSIDYLLPFKHFCKMQKEQCIQCCYCCLQSKKAGAMNLSTESVRELLRKIKKKVLMMLKLMWDRRVILMVVSYGFVGGVTILSNEIYPLLLVTDHVHGGYCMDDNEISLFIMMTGIALLFYQIFAYSRIVKITRYRHMLRISLVVFAIGNLLLPWANKITGPIDQQDPGSENGSGSETGSAILEAGYCGFNDSGGEMVQENSIKRLPASVWALMLLFTLMIILGRISSLVTLVVLVNNSAVSETRGTVNGIAQSFIAIFRSFTPALGSVLFAWSEKNGLSWPLNYHLTFELCTLFCAGIVLFTVCFPKSIEQKRTV